jgi:hypothetical protein
MRRLIVSLIAFLRSPIPQPLWVCLLVGFWIGRYLIGEIRAGGTTVLAMAVGLLLLFGGEWAVRRASDYVNLRTLPRQWDYSGHTLTLARDGSVVRGWVDGTHMVSWQVADIPYFAGSGARGQFQRVLEQVARGVKVMEDHNARFNQ